MNILFSCYNHATFAAAPLIRQYLFSRLKKGKEQAERLPERFGFAACPRPAGKILWIHAASVGEALSVLPLIKKIELVFPEWRCLFTTGTVTSAALLAERLPEPHIHHYVPADVKPWVNRFLNHWQPDAALWLESELWPCLLSLTAQRNIPLILVNGRLSDASFKKWQRVPFIARSLLTCFHTILAQTEEYQQKYQNLGGKSVIVTGNLKYDAPPLPYDKAALEVLQNTLKNRPVWLASSTHAGEEEHILECHLHLEKQYPDICTIIVPRHPHRGADIQKLAQNYHLTASRRSAKELPDKAVYIADTIGELGLFYRLSPIAFIGGSFIAHGGQNMLEPALLDTTILYGPHTFNFTEVVNSMAKADATLEVTSSTQLAENVLHLLKNPDMQKHYAEKAKRVASQNQGASEKIIAAMRALLQDT